MRYRIDGFTLVELVVTILIVSIIAVVASNILVTTFMSSKNSQEINQIDWEIKTLGERLSRDLARARSASTADLTLSPSTGITFVDIDGNTVVYAISGTTVTRTEGAGTAQNIATNVSSISFSYRDETGSVTATETAVKFITVDVTFALGDVNQVYRVTVFPRNFI